VEADGLEGAGGGGAHKSVVPDPREAFRKNVEEPAADELVGCEGEDAGLACFAACPVEADVTMFIVTDEALGADGAALYVAGEVTDGGVAAPDVLELDVPCFGGVEGGLGGGWETLVNLGVIVLEGEAHEVAEALGEGAVMDEEVLVFGVDEVFPPGVPGGGGDDAVDVRVVLELATPSVQDAGEAGDSAPGLGGDDVTQGVGALLEEGVVKFLGTKWGSVCKS